MINHPLLKIAKASLARLAIDAYQKPMAYAILRKDFKELATVPVFTEREQLWQECVSTRAETDKLTYVEFGVHEGYSLLYFAKHNHSRDSRFIGLDSFEGLPEDWGVMSKGTFDTKGIIPETNDLRICFIKGWFQDTWNELHSRLSTINTLVVHYDADLYSSTLFALTKIDSLKTSYTAIFDEFTGHETRALYNYLQAYGASVSFYGKTEYRGYPKQIVCQIVPRSARLESSRAL